MMNTRYKVDERTGCVAIMDTFFPNDSPGLHSDDMGVVKYSNLKMSWQLDWKSEETVREFNRLCDVLNKENTVTKEDADMLFQQLNILEHQFKRIFCNVRQLKIH